MNPTRKYLLFIAKTYGSRSLDRVYRQLAIKWHPDQGGDPERFKQLQASYEAVRFAAVRRSRFKKSEQSS